MWCFEHNKCITDNCTFNESYVVQLSVFWHNFGYIRLRSSKVVIISTLWLETFTLQDSFTWCIHPIWSHQTIIFSPAWLINAFNSTVTSGQSVWRWWGMIMINADIIRNRPLVMHGIHPTRDTNYPAFIRKVYECNIRFLQYLENLWESTNYPMQNSQARRMLSQSSSTHILLIYVPVLLSTCHAVPSIAG